MLATLLIWSAKLFRCLLVPIKFICTEMIEVSKGKRKTMYIKYLYWKLAEREFFTEHRKRFFKLRANISVSAWAAPICAMKSCDERLLDSCTAKLLLGKYNKIDIHINTI